MTIARLAIVPLLLWSGAGVAADYQTALQGFLDTSIRKWIG